MITGILILFPLLTALLLLTVKNEQVKSIAFTATIIEFLISLVAVFQFQYTANTQFLIDVTWIASLGIHFKVGMDGISLLLVMLTTFLVPLIVLSSFRTNYENPKAFYALLLLMQMALIGVFTSLDGFLFYVFWELALLPIYFICLRWGGKNREKITLKFFIYTLAGSLLMLLALIYLYLHTAGTHSFDIQAIYAAGASLDLRAQEYVFWAIFIAFAVKMPVFPFHSWQPDTYTNAPTTGTMMLSGVMLKMGTYGLIRWLLPVVPQGVAACSHLAIILAVIGIIYASCIAIVQKDFKRLIAYSSFAHVGLIAAGILAFNVQGLQGGMVQMISHGINVVGLFFIVDIIFLRTKTHEIKLLGGIRLAEPQFAALFLIIMLGAVALPLTNGFVGEFLLLNGLFQYSSLIAAFAATSVILGAVYMFRTYQRVMLGDRIALTETFEPLTFNEKAVLIPIVIMVIAIGIYPKPILDIAEPAVKLLVQKYAISPI
ncbi:MAG TPA: NADH-quinone oxidoreductase subunit M [Bacteroidia bacterium]|nr:NADH-quinone oxidoreductase subunit M [Bacteroidia bacterium]